VEEEFMTYFDVLFQEKYGKLKINLRITSLDSMMRMVYPVQNC